MIPILYERTETQFTSNGLGRLSDCISCECEQELNGVYELTLVYPIVGVHYKELAEKRIILVIPDNYSEPQQFQIYKITRPLNGQVTVYAQHISYLLSGMVALPFTANSAVAALDLMKGNAAETCPFEFTTDKTTTGLLEVTEPRSMRSIMGEDEDGILGVYGGEYEFNNYKVILHEKWGADNGVTLRYGKNITDINKESDSSETYAGLVPYWKGTDDSDNDYVVTLTDPIVWPEDKSIYRDAAVPYDFSDYFEDSEGNKVEPSQAQLKAIAETTLAKLEPWTIKTNIKVSFAQLWQTDEYKEYMQLERVRICDTVTVIYDALDVSASMRVVKTNFDVLNERYISIELGDAKNDISNEINGNIQKEINASQEETMTEMQAAIANGTKRITGGFGGYVVTRLNANKKPYEILVMDDEDINEATHVWRFNNQGIGYSDRGYNGPYKQAWTIDGAFYTDWVTAGKMTANLIKAGMLSAINDSGNYWDMVSGDFVLTNKNSDRGIVYKSGVLNIDANYITSGIITSNKPSRKNPNVYWDLDEGNLIVKKGTFQLGKTSLLDAAPGVYMGLDGLSAGRVVDGSNAAPAFFCRNNNYVRVWALGFFDPSKPGSEPTIRASFITDEKTDRIYTGHGMKIGGDFSGASNNTHIRGILYATVDGGSDERFKEEITDISTDDAVEFIKKTRPVTFRYKNNKQFPEGVHHGLIAQEVEKITGNKWNIVTEDEDGMKFLAYTEIIADLLAVEKQNLKEIDDLKERVHKLEEILMEMKK